MEEPIPVGSKLASLGAGGARDPHVFEYIPVAVLRPATIRLRYEPTGTGSKNEKGNCRVATKCCKFSKDAGLRLAYARRARPNGLQTSQLAVGKC